MHSTEKEFLVDSYKKLNSGGHMIVFDKLLKNLVGNKKSFNPHMMISKGIMNLVMKKFITKLKN